MPTHFLSASGPIPAGTVAHFLLTYRTTAGLAGVPAARFAGWALRIAALQDSALLFIGYEYASSVREIAAGLRTLGLFARGGAVLSCDRALLFARRASSAWGNEP